MQNSCNMLLSISVTETLKTKNFREDFSIKTCTKPDMLPTPRIIKIQEDVCDDSHGRKPTRPRDARLPTTNFKVNSLYHHRVISNSYGHNWLLLEPKN